MITNECTQATEVHVPTYTGIWHLVKKPRDCPPCHKSDDEPHPRFAMQARRFADGKLVYKKVVTHHLNMSRFFFFVLFLFCGN